MWMTDKDDIEIKQHGSTYNAQDDIDAKYPFQLCPECISDDTKVVDYSSVFGMKTGSSVTKRRGIFEVTVVNVNHKCRTCGCKWAHKYVDSRKSISVNTNLAYFIISLLVFALSLFMSISLIIVLDCYKNASMQASWYLYIGAGVIVMIDAVSFAMMLACTIDDYL